MLKHVGNCSANQIDGRKCKNVICFCRVAVIAVVTMLIGFAAIKLMFYGKVIPNVIFRPKNNPITAEPC